MKIYHPKKLEKVMHISQDGRLYQLDTLWKMPQLKKRLHRKHKVFEVDRRIKPKLFRSFHTNEFVESLLLGKQRTKIIESCGVFWQPYLPVAMYNRAQSVVLGLEDLLKGESLAIVLTDGGHHTTPFKAYGFGPINSIGVALYNLRLSLRGSKIAILDLDVHQGNGFSFIDMNDVHIFDIWSKRLEKWETNAKNKKYFARKVTNHNEWFTRFDEVLKQIMKIKPDILIYYSGVDVVSTDRMGGVPGFTLDMFKKREDAVFGFLRSQGIKLLLTFGGGYVDYSKKDTKAERENLVDNHLYTVNSAIKNFSSQ